MDTKRLLIGVVFASFLITRKLRAAKNIGLCSQEMEYQLEMQRAGLEAHGINKDKVDRFVSKKAKKVVKTVKGWR